MLLGSWKLGGEEVLGKENYVVKETPYFLHIVEEDKNTCFTSLVCIGMSAFSVLQFFGNTFNHKKGT
jgi:hypothetical protein